MYHQNNSFGFPISQMDGQQQYQQNYAGNGGQIEQQQQRWIGGMPMTNQQQQFMAQTPPMFGSSAGNVGTLKRQLDGGDGRNAEDKENLMTKRARIGLESGTDPPMPDEEEETQNQGGHNENAEEEDDEEEEDEENSGRSSSKTDEGSSPENSPIQQPTNQRQNNGQMGNNIVEQRQGNNASGHGQQHEAIVKEMTPLQKYMVPNSPYTSHMPSTPLAHSTPMLAGNIYANPRASNVLRNFQQYCGVPPSMIGSSAIAQMPPPFSQVYGSAPFSLPQIQHQPQSQLHSSAYSAQHQLMPFGISPNANNYSNPFMHPNQSTLPSFNSSSLRRDSGLGIECTELKALTNLKNTNESSSSSGGGTDESSISGSSSAPNLSIAKKNDQQITLAAAKFSPYIRQILQNGQKQFANLEEIMFGNPVPARLSLLNNNKKYPISLAEIHRRLSIPECLNTSYLSGILRRAKNKDGGSKLRQQLAEYDCGLELQTGKRKSSQVTTYTTLCEREALQLAEDFGKIANDPHNGFPHHQLAVELSRRSMLHSSPEQRKQKLEDVKSTMELLRSAISIVEQSIGQETLQLDTTMFGPNVADDHQQLTPQTLDQFKRFARLSHCFGNRAVLICWETMLKVFGHFERIHQSGDDTENGKSSSSGFMAAGTSQQQNDEQISANSLLELVKNMKNNSGNLTSGNN